MKKDCTIKPDKSTYEPLKTGIDGFDADVEAFQRLIDSESLKHVKSAALDYKLSPSELKKSVPGFVFRISSLASSEKTRHLIFKNTPAEVHPRINELIDVFQQNFSALLEHPARKEALKEILTEKKLKPALENKINPIVGVSHMSAWVGDPPELSGIIRLAFSGSDDGLLYEFTSDWENFSFIVQSITEVLEESISKADPLFTRGILAAPEDNGRDIEEAISKSIEALEKARRMMSKYGSSLESQEE